MIRILRLAGRTYVSTNGMKIDKGIAWTDMGHQKSCPRFCSLDYNSDRSDSTLWPELACWPSLASQGYQGSWLVKIISIGSKAFRECFR